MLRIAIWLLILGIGSLILPAFGLQFRLLSVFGNAQTVVGIGLALIGSILLLVHFIRQEAATTHEESSVSTKGRLF